MLLLKLVEYWVDNFFVVILANLVVGDSGCEDSEDEWDFIKIDKESETKPLSENQKSLVTTQTNKMSSEILNNPFSDNMKDSEIMSDMQSEPLTDDYHEKELVYNVDDTEKNDDDLNENSAATKLNPTAAEFVPRSPSSPVPSVQNPNLLLLEDAVVAQSPKPSNKNNDVVSALMENINVPSEGEFEAEISHRPHETEDMTDFIASHTENLNPKEAAQSDEKLEEDYIAISNGTHCVEQVTGASLMTFDRFNEPEAMQESFYEENRCDDLNKIQTLPMTQEQETHNEVNCLIEETGDIMSFDNINDMMVDPSQNLPVLLQSNVQVIESEKVVLEMEQQEMSVEKVDEIAVTFHEKVEQELELDQPEKETLEQIVNEIEMCQQEAVKAEPEHTAFEPR